MIVQVVGDSELRTIVKGGPSPGSTRTPGVVRVARVPRAPRTRAVLPDLPAVESILNGERREVYDALIERAGPWGLKAKPTKAAGITLYKGSMACLNVPVPQPDEGAFVLAVKTEHVAAVEDLPLRHLRAGRFRWQVYACPDPLSALSVIDRIGRAASG